MIIVVKTATVYQIGVMVELTLRNVTRKMMMMILFLTHTSVIVVVVVVVEEAEEK